MCIDERIARVKELIAKRESIDTELAHSLPELPHQRRGSNAGPASNSPRGLARSLAHVDPSKLLARGLPSGKFSWETKYWLCSVTAGSVSIFWSATLMNRRGKL